MRTARSAEKRNSAAYELLKASAGGGAAVSKDTVNGGTNGLH